MSNATLEIPAESVSTESDALVTANPLDRNLFFIKEHVGLFKASNNYDICDPETGEVILQCREPNLGPLTKILRYTDYRRMTPFDVQISAPTGELLVQVSRGICLFLSHVQVKDGAGKPLGGFKQQLFSIGGRFSVLDAQDEPVCELKGKWTGWDFRFLHGSEELAHVTKKWSGVGKELFTTADNYMLEISDHVPPSNPVRKLILAAVLTIDLVLKE